MIEQVFEYNQHFVAMMNVINSARLNPPKEGHKHHIIPKCWFKMMNLPIDNSKDNLVLLSKEQHCKVHKLMSLCAKDEQLKRNMVIAAQLMGLPATSLKYTHTDETRKKISESHKGKVFSEEHRRKLSNSHKGKATWNKGKKGIFSKETIRKISKASKCRSHSYETRKKMSEAKKGENHPLFGKHHSEETRKKISESHIGKVTTVFGEAFRKHFGINRIDNIKLYNKENYYYKRYGHLSWEIK